MSVLPAFRRFSGRFSLTVLIATLCAGAVPQSSLGDESTSFRRRTFQLSWSGHDLRRLQSLTLEADASVEVIPGRAGHPLWIWIDTHVQTEDDEGWVARWKGHLSAGSGDLGGRDPRVRAASLSCEEETRNGEIIRLSGVCVRKVRVAVPPDAMVDFTLAGWKGSALIGGKSPGRASPRSTLLLRKLTVTLAEYRAVRIENASADVHVEGGGEGAVFIVNGLRPSGDTYLNQGDVIARLTRMTTLLFNCVQGKIIVHLDEHDPDAHRVAVDGQRVTAFPFHRGRQPGLCDGPPTGAPAPGR